MTKKILLIILSLFTISCNKPIERSKFALNTICEIKIYKGGNRRVLNNAFKYIDQLEKLISRTEPESDVYKINMNFEKPVEISSETFALLKIAKRYSAETSTFDIAIGSITELWDFSSLDPVIPEKINIEYLVPYIDHRNIVLNEKKRTAMLTTSNASIDLGAIGKGFIGDMVIAYLKLNGVESALINLGGNVQTLGDKYINKKESKNWKVSIHNPFEENSSIAMVSIKDLAVVTSGDYEQFFIKDGVKYHHIIDKKTGFPAQSDIAAVTVISKNGAKADAYATALYIKGLRRTHYYLKDREDIAVMAIGKDKKVYISKEMEKYIIEKNEAYKFEEL